MVDFRNRIEFMKPLVICTDEEIQQFLTSLDTMQGAVDVRSLVVSKQYDHIEVLGEKSFVIVFNTDFDRQDVDGNGISRIGLVRVSTDTQKEAGYGVSIQTEEIVKYSRMKEYNLCAIVFDLGISGANYKELGRMYDSNVPVKEWFRDIRPGLHYALTHLSENNKLLSANPSRLWRDNDITGSQIRFHVMVKGSDLEFVEAPTFTLYEDEPVNYLTMMVQFNIADFEKQSINKRLRNGREKRAMTGKVMVSGANYGYHVHPNGMRTIDKQEAETVREIFYLHSTYGNKYAKIGRMLEAQGMYYRDGGSWTSDRVRNIIKKESLYRGWVVYGDTKKFLPDIAII